MVLPPLATFLRFLLVCSMSVVAVRAEDTGAVSSTEAIRHKLERIIIPRMDFRDATVREAVEFLKKKSAELDTDSPVGEGGVNIVFKLDGSNEKDAGNDLSQARITVSLTNIPLVEALKYVTGLSNLKFQVGPQAVSIVRPDLAMGMLITKEWKIPPDLIPGADKLKSRIDREIGKNWLIANGVNFDNTASAVYVVKSGRLIVRNTQDQVDLVDTIIASSQNAVGPVAMEIECRLVEVERERTKVLNSNPFDVTSRENVSVSGSDIVDQLAVPGTMPLSGVFTDPQFQMILRILKEQKHADIFSLPKVTVKSGQPAVVEFIRQYHNSQEVVPPQVRKLSPVVAVESSANDETPASIQRDRSISVAVEVTPVVGPDGYTIDLNISSQVSEFEGFVGYGNPFLCTNSSLGRMGGIVTPQPFPHPLYQTPKMKVPVSVYDGSTIFFNNLLGGAVAKEVAEKDLLMTRNPILGQLDEKGDDRPDRRLMLFVTTRLLTDSGDPVRAVDEKEEVIDPIKPPVNSR